MILESKSVVLTFVVAAMILVTATIAGSTTQAFACILQPGHGTSGQS